MSLLNEKTAWRLVAGGAAFTGAVAAHWVIKGAWKAWTEENPPENPADPTVGWERRSPGPRSLAPWREWRECSRCGRRRRAGRAQLAAPRPSRAHRITSLRS